MKRTAVFPGSFDPFTIGHESIVRRAIGLFDNIIIAIGINNKKPSFIDLDTRIKIIKKVFEGENRIEIKVYSGLTIDFCKSENCKYILRGLRTSADFEFERAIGQTNKLLNSEIETVFLLSLPQHTFISSSILREVILNNGKLDGLLPSNISAADFI